MDHTHARALKTEARRLGFHRVGIAEAGRSRHEDRFRSWLEAGRHGSMDYMARHLGRRVDPRETLAGATSIVVVSLPYADDVPFPERSETDGKIARYARGRDYHKVMPPLLRELSRFIQDGDHWKTWYAVDTAPILERDWAEQSGLGWIGKNGLIIDEESGSYFFLGVVVTDRPYAADPPAVDHCGSCSACIDACPTGAIVAPRSVDARRCISYLTIEHRGAIEPPLADDLHGWIFGCDICQEVCPFNTRRMRAPGAVPDDFEPRSLPTDLATLSTIDREDFVAAFAGTPVMRTRDAGMRRNAELNRSTPGGKSR